MTEMAFFTRDIFSGSVSAPSARETSTDLGIPDASERLLIASTNSLSKVRVIVVTSRRVFPVGRAFDARGLVFVAMFLLAFFSAPFVEVAMM